MNLSAKAQFQDFEHYSFSHLASRKTARIGVQEDSQEGCPANCLAASGFKFVSDS